MPTCESVDFRDMKFSAPRISLVMSAATTSTSRILQHRTTVLSCLRVIMTPNSEVDSRLPNPTIESQHDLLYLPPVQGSRLRVYLDGVEGFRIGHKYVPIRTELPYKKKSKLTLLSILTALSSGDVLRAFSIDGRSNSVSPILNK